MKSGWIGAWLRAGLAAFMVSVVGSTQPRPAQAQTCWNCHYVPGAVCVGWSEAGWKWCTVFNGICDHGPACFIPEGLTHGQPDTEGYAVELGCDASVVRVTTLGAVPVLLTRTRDIVFQPVERAPALARLHRKRKNGSARSRSESGRIM